MAKPAPARGVLEGSSVFVADVAQANRLHNRGFVGNPQPGNTLRLTLVEASYAVSCDRLVVQDDGGNILRLVDLLRGAENQREVHYLAHRDLRERGLVVKPVDESTYTVWPRGAGPQGDPWFTQRPLSEREPVTVGDLVTWCPGGKEADVVVLSIVDEDGAVTHYQLDRHDPRGSSPPTPLSSAAGTLLDDRVLVDDSNAARTWAADEHLGTRHGEGLILSLTEATHLHERGILVLHPKMDLAAHAASRQHHFTRTLPVYNDLRERGVVAKSGFKFGTHLRGYEGDPDAGHAAWLIHCARSNDTLHWSEISRAVRLAHGVRKHFLLAIHDAESTIHYLRLSWFRP